MSASGLPAGTVGKADRSARRVEQEDVAPVDGERDRRIGKVALLRGLVDGDVVLLLRLGSDDGERRGVDIEQRLAAEAFDHLDDALEPRRRPALPNAKLSGRTPSTTSEPDGGRSSPSCNGMLTAGMPPSEISTAPSPLAVTSAGKKFMRGEPRKPATKTLLGRL